VLKVECSLARTKNDLEKQLTELKKELLTLRVQKIAGGSASKLTKMYVRTSHSLRHELIQMQ
jgi:ribosomal protein L29